jgi:hypothetical protein
MAHNPYARFIEGQDAGSLVRAFPSKLSDVTARLGDLGMGRSLGPGKWTASEILCHLADTEIAFSFRWRQTLALDSHTVQTFDQDSWARRYSLTPGEEALKTFLALRHWNVLLLDRLEPQAWRRALLHPELGEMSFETLVEIMAGHDLNHLAQLERLAAGA